MSQAGKNANWPEFVGELTGPILVCQKTFSRFFGVVTSCVPVVAKINNRKGNRGWRVSTVLQPASQNHPAMNQSSVNTQDTHHKPRNLKMLVLTRRIDETILIDGQIEIQILKVKGNTVRLGIKAPRDVKVLRGELAPFGIAEMTVELASEIRPSPARIVAQAG